MSSVELNKQIEICRQSNFWLQSLVNLRFSKVTPDEREGPTFILLIAKVSSSIYGCLAFCHVTASGYHTSHTLPPTYQYRLVVPYGGCRIPALGRCHHIGAFTCAGHSQDIARTLGMWGCGNGPTIVGSEFHKSGVPGSRPLSSRTDELADV